MPKLTLTWLDADASLEDLLAFFRALTGREPTPEEIEAVQADLEPQGRGDQDREEAGTGDGGGSREPDVV
jgi:hypothetical protein